MSGEPETGASGLRTGAMSYIILCGASLALAVLVLLGQGQSPMVCLVILLIGLVGVVTRMSLAPVIVVLTVAAYQLVGQLTWDAPRGSWQLQTRGSFVISDILLAAAVLGYVIGHYRLQGLSRHIFPPDLRLRVLHRYTRPVGQAGNMPAIERKRAVHLVTPAELTLLVLSLPFWALAAQLVWHYLAQTRDVLGREHKVDEWNAGVVRTIVLVTILTATLVTVAALLRYLRRRRMTEEEARLMMQDTLWNETRGEQRRFARWLTWFTLDQNERKERP
jgi:hypothetical protein